MCSPCSRLGVSSYALPAERVNQQLLDELGKRLVQQPNKFDEMAGYRVGDDIRKQLQAKIAQRQRGRSAEIEGRASQSKKPGRLGGCSQRASRVQKNRRQRQRQPPPSRLRMPS